MLVNDKANSKTEGIRNPIFLFMENNLYFIPIIIALWANYIIKSSESPRMAVELPFS